MTCHNMRISANLQFETSNLTNLMMGVKQRNTCPNADYFCSGQGVSTQLTQFTLKNHTAGNIKGATSILRALGVSDHCAEVMGDALIVAERM